MRFSIAIALVGFFAFASETSAQFSPVEAMNLQLSVPFQNGLGNSASEQSPSVAYSDSDRSTRRRFAGLSILGVTLAVSSLPVAIASFAIEAGSTNPDRASQRGLNGYVVGAVHSVLGLAGLVTAIVSELRRGALIDAPASVRRRHRRRLIPAAVLIGLAYAALAASNVVGVALENS